MSREDEARLEANLERKKEQLALARQGAEELAEVNEGLLARLPKWVGVPVEVTVGYLASAANGMVRAAIEGSALDKKVGDISAVRTLLGVLPLGMVFTGNPDLEQMGVVASVGFLGPEISAFTYTKVKAYLAMAPAGAAPAGSIPAPGVPAAPTQAPPPK